MASSSSFSGDVCMPASDTWDEGGYQFRVWQRSAQSLEIMIELGCTSDAEAYVLAMKFLRMVNFSVWKAELKTWKGQHMMYYAPRNGWYFGDDRDTVPF